MRLTSTGLGIGTSSPDAKLQVQGTSGSSAYLRFGRYNGYSGGIEWRSYSASGGWDLKTGTGSNADLIFSRTEGSGNYIFNDANLGLGVTPSAWATSKAFQIGNRASLFSFNNLSTDVGNNAYFNGTDYKYIETATATFYRQNTGAHSWYNAPSGTAGNTITFTQAMTLDASGRLGIGQTSPTTVIDAQDATGATRITLTNTANAAAGSGINFIVKNGATTVGNATIRVDDSDNLAFFNIGGERVRISSAGELLVGTTTTNRGNSGFHVASNGQFFSSTDSSTNLNLRRIASNGDAATFTAISGSIVGAITIGTTTTTYNTSSDYRLKNTIAPMTGALAKVALLKPCTYKWNADGSDGQGFIAHELAEVVPHAVTGEKDAVDAEGNPKYQGIDTSFLVATLTAAIQEQQAIINSLKARLDAANL